MISISGRRAFSSVLGAGHFRFTAVLKVPARYIIIYYAKRSFYRALNVVLGKVGRVASVPVVLELVSSKCLPILLYGL